MVNTSQLVTLAKRLKHLLHLGVRPLRARVEDFTLDARAALSPFVWDDSRFAESHAGRALPPDPLFDPTGAVPRQIWGIWSGDNAMSPNRARGWNAVQSLNQTTPCRLVTPSTLSDIEVAGFPLHRSYEHLTLVHRSDYLRAYLMHLHGGGYTDIKPATHSWTPFFDRIDQSPEAWALGYPERGSLWVSDLPAPIRDLPKRYHGLLIADGAFIMRPRSPLTALWFDEVHKRMDYYADDLARFPGEGEGIHRRYPMRWTGLLGDINGGILLRFHHHLVQEPDIRPVMTNYR